LSLPVNLSKVNHIHSLPACTKFCRNACTPQGIANRDMRPNESPFHMRVWWYLPFQLSPANFNTLPGRSTASKDTDGERLMSLPMEALSVHRGMVSNTFCVFWVSLSISPDGFQKQFSSLYSRGCVLRGKTG